MLTLMTLLMLFLVSMSPMVMTFMVTAVSITLSMMLIKESMMSFPSAAIIISFSSGMMILFCYCSILSNYEMKSSNKSILFFMALAMSAQLTTEETVKESMELSSNMISPMTSFFLMGMMMVALAMTSVNKSLLKPSSSMLVSY